MINIFGKYVESKIINKIMINLHDNMHFEVDREISDELYFEIGGDDEDSIINEAIREEATFQIRERINRI